MRPVMMRPKRLPMKQLVDQVTTEVTLKCRQLMLISMASYADEAQIEASIKAVYEETGYVLDPHGSKSTSVYSDIVRR